MPVLRKWKLVFVRLRAYSPVAFELGVCAASYRAAYILLMDPDYFSRREQAFAWVSHIIASEWVWGVLALIAALLKTIGFFGFFSKTENQIETIFLLRAMGWAMSAVIWTCMGISFLTWRSGQIDSGSTLLLGVLCIGMVLAGPVYPETKDAR